MISGEPSIGDSIAVWFRQVAVMTAKEFPQLVRDRAVFAYIVFIFTLNILIAAGQSLELNNVKIIVNDADQSMVSRELSYRFREPYFKVAGRNLHPDTALDWLDRGTATLLVDIPPDFSETLYRGDEVATVQMQVDTSIANIGFLAASYGSRIVAELGAEFSAQRLSAVDSLPRIDNQRRIRFNPGINEAWFSTISELLAVITIACIFLPSVAMVREKERGTIEQLLVSPLSPFQVIFAKVLAMVIVMLIGTAVSLFLIMQPLFDVPARGNLGLFFVLTALYAIATAGLGMLVATFVRNTAQLGMLLMLIIFPTIMLSGLWVQLESMPIWLRSAIDFTPMRYFVDIAYGILLRGAGLEILWDSVLKMAGIGVVLFSVALWRFRRQFGG
ncbi:MAG: ABC transporter permease [Pseudomonadales bacterium]